MLKSLQIKIVIAFGIIGFIVILALSATYIYNLDYTPSIKKKDYTRHFLKKPKK